MTTKQLTLILITLIVLLAIALIGRSYVHTMVPAPVTSSTPTPVPSISEAAVTASTTATMQFAIGQSASALGLTIRPLEVVEDSRCKVEVQCIQAGTIKLSAEVTILGPTKSVVNQTFTLGQSVLMNNIHVILVEVTPVAHANTAISQENYKFLFTLTK